MTAKAVRWFTVEPDKGWTWTVYLAPPTHRELRKPRALGLASFDDCAIYVSWGQTEANVYSTLLHELAHVAIHRCGLPGTWEESLVMAMEPVLIRTLATMPATLPPIPPSVARRLKRDRRPPFRVKTAA
jgi:hypothetical protein